MSDIVKGFLTIKENVQAEIVEKKSKFIANLFYIENIEEAEKIIKETRKKYFDARHNCIAYRVIEDGQIIERFSDDGEPQGTAGKPILEVITGNQVVNICIVVTRYFGGTLLGTGGLVRAYTEAAKLALADAGIHTMQLMKLVSITTNYNDSGKVQYLLSNSQAVIDGTDYTMDVCFKIAIPADEYGRLEKQITESTSARAVLEVTGEEYR